MGKPMADTFAAELCMYTRPGFAGSQSLKVWVKDVEKLPNGEIRLTIEASEAEIEVYLAANGQRLADMEDVTTYWKKQETKMLKQG